MKHLILLLLAIAISGCAVVQKAGLEFQPEVAANKLQKEFDEIPPPDGKKVTIAVYSFTDKTGQRKPTPGIANLSSAVTQGAEVFLIRALQDVGRGEWFDVVERVGIDSLTKERTIIRQMREAYEGKDAKPLMPLQFAGIIMEGGIIGYDSGSESGGAAHRFLGIGAQTQYSKDTVTISLRAVSVNTGKVLATVTVTKVVYSTADSVAVLKFLRNGTEAFEAEAGLTINEPGTLAVKATIESAVVELIKEGERRGVWDFKKPPVAPLPPEPVVYVVPPAPIVKDEIPVVTVVIKEEPKVEIKPTPEVTSPQSSIGKKMFLVESTYVRGKPSSDPYVTRLWLFDKNEEVVIVSQTDVDWVEVKNTMGKKGFIKLEKLKEKN